MPVSWRASGIALLIVGTIAISSVAVAAEFSVPLFDVAPEIDGDLSDQVWTAAREFDNFFQFQPGDGTPPSDKTTVLVGYDRKNFFVAFRCEVSDRKRARYQSIQRDSDNNGVESVAPIRG